MAPGLQLGEKWEETTANGVNGLRIMPFGNSLARLLVPEGQTAIAQRFIAGFGRAGDMRPGGTKEGSFLHRWLIAVTLSSLPDFEPLGRVPQR